MGFPFSILGHGRAALLSKKSTILSRNQNKIPKIIVTENAWQQQQKLKIHRCHQILSNTYEMHAPPGAVFAFMIKPLQTFQRETTNKTRCHYLQNKNLKQNRLYNRDEMNLSRQNRLHFSVIF